MEICYPVNNVTIVGTAMIDDDKPWEVLKDDCQPAENDKGITVVFPLLTVKISTIREWWKQVKRLFV